MSRELKEWVTSLEEGELYSCELFDVDVEIPFLFLGWREGESFVVIDEVIPVPPSYILSFLYDEHIEEVVIHKTVDATNLGIWKRCISKYKVPDGL